MRLEQTGKNMYVNLDLVRRVGLLEAGGQYHVCLWFSEAEYMIVDTSWSEEAASFDLQYWVEKVGGAVANP